MKIAIEAQRLFRTKKHGMDIVALELIRHLQEIDKENEYFIFVKADKDDHILIESENFHIINLPKAPYPVWEQIYLPKAIKKVKPDIVHCTSNTAPLFLNIPLVLTLHDILYLQKIDFTRGTWYQRFGNLYRKWIVPRLIDKCLRIVTVSNFEKNEINAHFALTSDRVTPIYNACSAHFKPIHDQHILQAYKEKYSLPDKFVLYLGNTHPNKNLRNVLKAMSLLRREKTISIPMVMPDVSKTLLDKILLEIEDLDLKESIYLTGYVPNNELPYIYNLATVFIYPSFYESFGIPMLEAMSCGIPVIASNRAAMPEIANGTAKIINPEDPNDIMQAIKTLISNPSIYSEYRRNGFARSALFSWETTAKKMIQLYEGVYKQSIHSKLPTGAL